MSEDDLSRELEPAPPRDEGGGNLGESLRALGLGVVVDVGGSILATRLFLVSMIMFAPIFGFEWGVMSTAWLFIIGLAGLFGGSFLAAHLAPSRPLLHAALVGVADIAATFFLSSSAGLSVLLLGYLALIFPTAIAASSVARWIEPRDRPRLAGRPEPPLIGD